MGLPICCPFGAKEYRCTVSYQYVVPFGTRMDVRFRGDDGGVGRGTGYRYVAPSGQLDIINDVPTKIGHYK